MKLKNRDKLLLEIASKCGAFSWDIANEFGLNSKRLKQLENENFITKLKFNVYDDDIKRTRTKNIYKLNDAGKDFCIINGICSHFAPATGIKHTLKAEQKYLELREQYDTNQILNESEQRYVVFKDTIKELEINKVEFSVSDFCILNDNGFEFIEIITENYRDKDFKEKENYCNSFGCKPTYF